MKALIVSFLAVLSFFATSAQDGNNVKELEKRVRRLEERLAALEKAALSPEVKMKVKAAHQRDSQDHKNFKAEDIAKAEEMYQRAAQRYIKYENDPNPALDSVVSAYPQLNRAGCAQLYRAQQESGPEKERLLKDCLDRFSGCYYFDGAQVGPLAMLQLAFYYKQTDRNREAGKLFKQLREKYPESVNHGGRLLVSEIE